MDCFFVLRQAQHERVYIQTTFALSLSIDERRTNPSTGIQVSARAPSLYLSPGGVITLSPKEGVS